MDTIGNADQLQVEDNDHSDTDNTHSATDNDHSDTEDRKTWCLSKRGRNSQRRSTMLLRRNVTEEHEMRTRVICGELLHEHEMRVENMWRRLKYNNLQYAWNVSSIDIASNSNLKFSNLQYAWNVSSIDIASSTKDVEDVVEHLEMKISLLEFELHSVRLVLGQKRSELDTMQERNQMLYNKYHKWKKKATNKA